MKSLYLILLFVSSLQIANGQTYIKTIYHNEYGEEITSEESAEANPYQYYLKVVETETYIIKTLQSRKHEVQFDSIQFVQLKLFLKKITGEGFDERKNTMIHLYRTDDLKNDDQNKAYWNWVHEHSESLQSFLVGTKNSGITAKPKKQVYLDEYDMLDKLFFKGSDYDLNHLYIQPNGTIFFFYGMDDISAALDSSL